MRKKVIIGLWCVLFLLLSVIAIAFWAIFEGYIGYMPNLYQLENPVNKFASQVVSCDGRLLGTWSYQRANRIFVPYNEIAPSTVQALVATEDVRFYEHSGIDFKALGRALVKRGLMRQVNAGGGSTITQQLAKQLYSEKAHSVGERLLQKPIEWVIALKLERFYTKEEIISMYLNYFDFLHNAVETVTGLLEIVGMRILVDGVFNLVYTWQRVEDTHVGASLAEHIELQEIAVLDAFIFHEVGETLTLHTCHVKDVGSADDIGIEILVLYVADAMLAAVVLVGIGHGKLIRGDEMEGGVEMAHGHEQGMDGAAILEVAHHIDIKIVEGALGLVDGVKVKHRLRGVLVGSVARIDNGYGGNLAGIASCPFEIVAHDDDVGIVGHHHNGVLQRLALGAAGHLRVGKADDTGSEAIGGGLKAEAGAGAGLEKERGHYLALQQFTVGMALKLAGHLYHVENLFASEVGDGYEVHGISCVRYEV